MEKHRYDIGVVIPLQEEYRYVVEVAPQLDVLSHDGTYFYDLDFGTQSVVACICGAMGPLAALHSAGRLLQFADVKLLVVLGLAGALDTDVSVGDVVIAEEVNEFQAKSKAVTAGDGYTVKYSGNHWPLDFAIRQAISNFEFAGAEAFNSWQNEAAERFSGLSIPEKEDICPNCPSLHSGPLASGNIVAASTAFVDEIKNIDRKFIAIDMEAAGAAKAAQDRLRPVPCLVVRGMSDHANEEKKELDSQGERTWRNYCVLNAASFLKYLLTWNGFTEACGLKPQLDPDSSPDLKELVAPLQDCPGGVWAVGLAFGLYPYGLRVDGDSAVPMDASQLQAVDVRFAKLQTELTEARESFLADADISRAAERIRSAITVFGRALGSPDAVALLQDFDKVVVECLLPTADDELEAAVLLEAERLEEEIGPDAAAEFLSGLSEQPVEVRERLIDLFVSMKRWGDVIGRLESVDDKELTRLELEHILSSYLCEGRQANATAAYATHAARYEDNAAQLLRNQLLAQHPGLDAGPEEPA